MTKFQRDKARSRNMDPAIQVVAAVIDAQMLQGTGRYLPSKDAAITHIQILQCRTASKIKKELL
jgi:hypothetical protein